MKPGSVGELCLKEKKKILVEVPKEKSPWGIPYIVNAMPFCDEEGAPVGCVITTERIDRQEILRNMSETLRVASERLSESLQNLNLYTQSITEKISFLEDSIHVLSDKIDKTESINTYIKSISNKTNILGLNAVIEAARAGNEGGGFAVVAHEIRKLAVQSSESTSNIHQEINTIRSSFSSMSNQYNDVIVFIQKQSNIIHDLASAGQELTSIAQELESSVSEISVL